MKNIILILAVFALAGCGSVTTTKTTEYDKDGNIVKVTEVTSDASDFACLVASSEGSATTLSADVTKFNLGYGNYGLNWLSVSGVRVKAPKDTSGELGQTANVIQATKTTIQTKDLGVNKEVPK